MTVLFEICNKSFSVADILLTEWNHLLLKVEIILISDSTAQSVLCQPIVQSNGELIGECSGNQFVGYVGRCYILECL